VTRFLPWSFRLILVILLCFCGTRLARGDCKAPSYRVGRTYDNAAPAVLLNIAVRQEDFAPASLICLASVLKRTYQAPEVAIGIFSSYRAALNYLPLGVEFPKDAVLWASKQHAEYYFSAEKHEEYLLLIPDGLSLGVNSAFNTRIDLPVTGKPSCKLEIRSRCLLEFAHMALPREEPSGSITLTGRIEPNGSVSRVRLVVLETNSSSTHQGLADFAIRNLKSWRFERDGTKDAVRITYSLERGETDLEHGTRVHFMLPGKVNIQTGPLLIRR